MEHKAKICELHLIKSH